MFLHTEPRIVLSLTDYKATNSYSLTVSDAAGLLRFRLTVVCSNALMISSHRFAYAYGRPSKSRPLDFEESDIWTCPELNNSKDPLSPIERSAPVSRRVVRIRPSIPLVFF